MTASTERRTESSAQIRADVAEIIGTTVYATMTTVDRRGRPRSRVLIVVWDLDGPRPVGWLATLKTPVKPLIWPTTTTSPPPTGAHARTPSYLDSVATWIDDADTDQRVWHMCRQGSPPRRRLRPRGLLART